MKASVVIPALNEEKYLGKCLESLRGQTVEAEIIVVDSSSADRTLDIARQHADKTIVSAEKNIPYNRQRGVEEATGEIIITTDADCIHRTDWVEKILKHFENPKVLAVSGPTIPINEEAVFLDKLCYFTGNVCVLILHKLGVVWFRGSNSAYRKEAITKVGGYNTKLLAREDSDLSSRVAKVGKTIFDPDIIVMTSMRRRKSMGWLRTIRYYIDTPIALVTKKVYYRKV